MFNVYLPHRNLGCFGVRLGRFYFDLYPRPWTRFKVPGLFLATPTRKVWIVPFRITTDR